MTMFISVVFMDDRRTNLFYFNTLACSIKRGTIEIYCLLMTDEHNHRILTS